MSCCIMPVGHGNHNNIHLIFKIGSKKQPMVRIKMVGFFDTGNCYILNSVSKIPYDFLNHKVIFQKINELLEKHELNLKFIGKNDLNNKNLKTENILNYECISSNS